MFSVQCSVLDHEETSLCNCLSINFVPHLQQTVKGRDWERDISYENTERSETSKREYDILLYIFRENIAFCCSYLRKIEHFAVHISGKKLYFCCQCMGSDISWEPHYVRVTLKCPQIFTLPSLTVHLTQRYTFSDDSDTLFSLCTKDFLD